MVGLNPDQPLVGILPDTLAERRACLNYSGPEVSCWEASPDFLEPRFWTASEALKHGGR